MKRQPTTPRSQVRRILAQLFLRSRERQAALKRDRYTCQNCGRKRSKAKGREFAVEEHHIAGIDWKDLLNLIYERLLVDPFMLITYCKKCHKMIGEELERFHERN